MARVGHEFTAQDSAGNILATTAVAVRLRSDNSLATIYDAETGGSTITQPGFQTNANGIYAFWAEPEKYNVTVGSGASANTYPLDLLGADGGNIKALYELEPNAFTDADHAKLDQVMVQFDTFADLIADTASHSSGTYLYVKKGAHTYEVVASSGNLGQATAGGVELDVLPTEMGYDVTAFGATGDGTTDDTSEIQSAIDAAYVSSGYDNRAIYVPVPATGYLISSTLNMRQRVEVRGESKWNCRVFTNSQIVLIEQPHLISNIHFDGVSIKNATDKIHQAAWSPSTDRANTAIVLGPADGSFQGGHAIVRECRFSNWGVAIEGPDCINPEIHGCYFSGGYHDVYFRADRTALGFASTVKETKNYHAGGEGVGLGFYANPNGYQVVDISGSVYETLCRTETTLGYIDAPSIAVRAFGGDCVYFENNSATHPNSKAIRTGIFSGSRIMFNGFNRILESATTSSFWSIEDSEVIAGSGSYDVSLPANGRNLFRNVSFGNGVDTSNPGNTVFQQCSNTGILTDSNDFLGRGVAGTFQKNSAAVVTTDRGGTDGSVHEFKKSGTTFGSIDADGGRLKLVSQSSMFIEQNNSTRRQLFFDTNTFRPTNGDDNTMSLGNATGRWSEVFAVNGTINTSDGRLKTQVSDIDEAEKSAALECKSLIKKYKWRDSVKQKGDDARIHFGVIAQEVVAVFAKHGLDAMKYGVIHYDEWEAQDEIRDDDGNLIQEARSAGDRYGVNYNELLALIISAM